MKTIAFVNQKGGVGKTTTALNVGAALAKLGERVLLIDFDPQGSLTTVLGINGLPDDQATSYEVISGSAKIQDARISIDLKYDLLPLDVRMSGTEDDFLGKEDRLKKALDQVESDYDFCLIDCSPALNRFTFMALAAADFAIIPVPPQYLPIAGLILLSDTISAVQKSLNPKLKLLGLIITLYDGRRNQDRELEPALRSNFQVFRTTVRYNSKIAEAPMSGKDIFETDPKGYGASAYMDIATEIIERVNEE